MAGLSAQFYHPEHFMKASTLIIAVLVAISAGSCSRAERLFRASVKTLNYKGNGETSSQSRALRDFTVLDVSGGLHVDVQRGDWAVTVRADSNLLDELETSVQNGILRIQWKEGVSIIQTRAVEVDISMPELSGLKGSGATRFELADFSGDRIPVVLNGASRLDGKLSYKAIELEVNGASRVELSIPDTDTLKLAGSGASSIELGGKATSLTVSLSGTSRLDAQGLASQHAELEASGASRLRLAVSDSVSGELSGASSLRYKGSPDVSVKTSGGSSVGTM